MIKKSAKLQLNALGLDLDATIPFLRSVAYFVVAQRTTKIRWVDEEGPIKYLYKAFLGAFGTPGTVTVDTAEEGSIREQVEIETLHRINILMKKIEYGPQAVADFLQKQNELRIFCKDAVQSTYAEANSINADIARAWGKSIEFAANIKLGSTIAVKTMGLVPGPGWAIAIGFDVIVGTIDDLSQAGNADSIVVVFAETATKEGAKELAGDVAERAVDVVNGKPTEKELKVALSQLRLLQDKISRQVAKLEQRAVQKSLGIVRPGTQDSIKSLTTQVARNTQKLSGAEKTVVKSIGKYTVAKAVGWAFFANDVYEAFEERNRVIADARQ